MVCFGIQWAMSTLILEADVGAASMMTWHETERLPGKLSVLRSILEPQWRIGHGENSLHCTHKTS